ncbi:MAG TPA: S1C family serine protease [Terriglobia bacterium]|nr:S1C family serine protease [Terriglobia bacterium]
MDSSGVQGDLCATGFFVALPCESPELRPLKNMYFVTAKHVVTDLQNRQAFLLLNTRSGGTLTVTGITKDWWHFHPTDATADVAVIPINPGTEVEALGIDIQLFGLPEVLKNRSIGIGDEVITVGLFNPAPGTSRSQPIVRHGNISMLPTEQIQTELGYADVILVEARSIGGISGSPVFVRNTFMTKVKNRRGEDDVLFANGPGVTLLGLMHGHWDIRESDLNKPSIIHDRQHGVNMGIAMVVPAAKIQETLYAPDLIAIRQESERKLLSQSVPGMD